MQFNEDFLQYIWQFQQFDHAGLCTEAGDEVKVINAGTLNTDSGADFSNAFLRINGTEWAGNIEVHISASDWVKHRHQLDAAYNNVILHVVYYNDVSILRPDGTSMPVICLAGRIEPAVFSHYEQLITSPFHFPCKAQLPHLEQAIVDFQITRMVLERLIQRTESIVDVLVKNHGDWNETFYYFLLANFGFNVNKVPFQCLAKILPFKIISKHSENSDQVAALLFGQAGFLSGKMREDYPRQLQSEYQFLRKKYGMEPMHPSIWKFLRMRPLNFPTIRLAQLSAFLSYRKHIFSAVLDARNAKDLTNIFASIPMHSFWETHFHFSKQSKSKCTNLGKTSIYNLLINTCIPFLFAYGQFTDQEELRLRAISMLENVPPDLNSKVEPFKEAGIAVNSGFMSQGILQLYTQYCLHKRCLRCSVGINILNPKKIPPQQAETG